MARCEKCDIPLTNDSRTCPQCGRYVNVKAPVQRVGKSAVPAYQSARPPAPNPGPPKRQSTSDFRVIPPPKSKPRIHTVPLTALSRTSSDPKKVPSKAPGFTLPKGVTKVWMELRVETRLLRGENELSAIKRTEAFLALVCSKDGKTPIVLSQSSRFPLVSPSVPTPEAIEALKALRARAVINGLAEQRLPSGANWFSYRYDVPGQGNR